MSQAHVIIMGAAGRDFHNVNTYFCDNQGYQIIGRPTLEEFLARQFG